MFLAIDAMREDKVLRRKAGPDKAAAAGVSRSKQEDRPDMESLADKHAGREWMRVETRDLIAHLMRHLQADERRLLLLHYVDGLSLKEIAKIYGRSEPAICLRHKALLARMRRLARVSPNRPEC